MLHAVLLPLPPLPNAIESDNVLNPTGKPRSNPTTWPPSLSSPIFARALKNIQFGPKELLSTFHGRVCAGMRMDACGFIQKLQCKSNILRVCLRAVGSLAGWRWLFCSSLGKSWMEIYMKKKKNDRLWISFSFHRAIRFVRANNNM